ncbi:RNA polymerase sigma factor [Demequina sp.]|uniref:RNA polymerase sigma factor n=1 Tax=Demequina sp. TaxID=2050685 RepID=UPI003D118B9F
MADLDEVLAGVTRTAGARLAAYGFILTGSQSDAEELVQEAIVKTFVRRPRLSDPAAAEQYVRLAMKTLVIDKSRKARRWHERVPQLAMGAEQGEHVTAISTRVAVEKALSSLTPQQRIAVALRYWDDMTVPEVAAAMRLNPGTVKRYLFDAAAVLRPLLGDHVEPADLDEDIRIVNTKRGRR